MTQEKKYYGHDGEDWIGEVKKFNNSEAGIARDREIIIQEAKAEAEKILNEARNNAEIIKQNALEEERFIKQRIMKFAVAMKTQLEKYINGESEISEYRLY